MTLSPHDLSANSSDNQRADCFPGPHLVGTGVRSFWSDPAFAFHVKSLHGMGELIVGEITVEGGGHHREDSEDCQVSSIVFAHGSCLVFATRVDKSQKPTFISVLLSGQRYVPSNNKKIKPSINLVIVVAASLLLNDAKSKLNLVGVLQEHACMLGGSAAEGTLEVELNALLLPVPGIRTSTHPSICQATCSCAM
jgi:hypothetical protein